MQEIFNFYKSSFGVTQLIIFAKKPIFKGIIKILELSTTYWGLMTIRLSFLFILCTIGVYSNAEDALPGQEQTTDQSAESAQNNEPKPDLAKNNIIVTMEKLLLGVESSAVTNRLGYINLARCVGWHKAGALLLPGITGASQQQEFFNLLAKILLPEFKKIQSIEYKGKEIPELLYHCWLGTTDNNTLLKNYRARIKSNTELFDVEKETLHEGAALATTEYHTILKRIDGGIELVKQLKENKQNRLYLILNGNGEIVAALKKEHADIFELFDEVIPSHEAQAINTQKEIYQYALKKYQLNLKNTFAVVSFNTNKRAAQQANMTIVNAKKQDFGYAQEQLEKLGLL